MTTMVEKVAKMLEASFKDAIEEGSGRPFIATGVSVPSTKVFERYARAAIEAMMEPTEAMLDAGDAADGYDVYVGVWTAMIQAAIKEGQ